MKRSMFNMMLAQAMMMSVSGSIGSGGRASEWQPTGVPQHRHGSDGHLELVEKQRQKRLRRKEASRLCATIKR